jgi:hypothetical protein
VHKLISLVDEKLKENDLIVPIGNFTGGKQEHQS